MSTLNDIVTEEQPAGNCKVNVDLVVSKWNHTWGIYQWQSKYRLIKHVRLGTPSTRIKVQISSSQANEIIHRLNLNGEPSAVFASATTWR